MWDKLLEVHGGNEHVLEVKVEGSKGEIDVMNMHDHDTISHYGIRIKEIIASVKGVGGIIEESEVVSKMLRTLSSRYAIRVSTIHKLRTINKERLQLILLLID